MTPEQQEHINKIIVDFAKEAEAKYEKGQIEHGGNLWQKAVWKQTMPEALDFVVYIATLNQQIEDLLRVCLELAPNHPELENVMAPFFNLNDTPESRPANPLETSPED